MKKLLYFGYYILKSDYKNILASINCLKSKYNPLKLIIGSVYCSLKYGTTFDDYFSFRFYEKTKEERATFATTAFMYEFHKKMNDARYVQKIDNKIEFQQHFKQFSHFAEIFTVDNDGVDKCRKWLIENNFVKIVIKAPEGTTGKGIYFLDYHPKEEYFLLEGKKYGFIEVFQKFSYKGKIYIEPQLKQHPEIQALAPSALNTVRIITVLDKLLNVDIIAATLRISISGNTDNFSTGNLAATIDIETGVIITPGIKRNAACSKQYHNHPVTNVPILGFKMPHWENVIEKVKNAALVFPQIRTVGWDVAILEKDVVIIEGNPSWNKGAPQIPNNKGIKVMLEKYLND